ncbi:MAG: formate dehydrogenase subunit gamma [Gemmatimonadales bacterium]
MKRDALKRFTFAERVLHWVVGVTFVILLLTGLALSYPKLYWLTALVGGGSVARVLHPWTGVVFTVGLVVMSFMWLKEMWLARSDLEWLRAIKYYARHERDRVPPAGKYNGGQKLFFWVQAVLGVVFLVTGVPLWIPGAFGAGFLTVMRLLHYLAALGGGLLLILHVYLGTVAFPGTARAMLRGTVTGEWARLHHPLWYEEQANR